MLLRKRILLPLEVHVVYSSLTKRKKIEFDNKQKRSACVIQRFYRQYVKGLINSEDLFLDPFHSHHQHQPIFRHIINEFQSYRFIPKQLADAMLKNGRFCNPYNQQEFNNVELRRLTTMVKKVSRGFSWDFSVEKHRSLIQQRVSDRQNQEENVDLYVQRVSFAIREFIKFMLQEASIMEPEDLFFYLEQV